MFSWDISYLFSLFSQFEYKDATSSTGMCISVLVNSFVTVPAGRGFHTATRLLTIYQVVCVHGHSSRSVLVSGGPRVYG